ncbi:hypothetical protein CesoFtcFv8_000485 [Champsocephalus esox]|uniref:Uncharacterized protein n=1 Tax=Champsocephalus esox TaxID=159716 RepID=A0AAN8D3X5_9TELE|nr:hypothetical protein CesoFtcFv8_000485 [Champsocephalus esox]
MEELGRREEALSRRMEAELGRRQEELDKRQEELDRRLEELDRRLEELDRRLEAELIRGMEERQKADEAHNDIIEEKRKAVEAHNDIIAERQREEDKYQQLLAERRQEDVRFQDMMADRQKREQEEQITQRKRRTNYSPDYSNGQGDENDDSGNEQHYPGTCPKTKRTKTSAHTSMPLIAAGRRGFQYQPWTHRDMEALVSKLPPLTKGGQKWVNDLERYTAQDHLCLGDMRALLGRIEGRLEVRAIDSEANCTNDPDDTPFNYIRSNYWAAIRHIYPTTRSLHALNSLRKGTEEEMHAFLKRCEGVWEDYTGERHDVSPAVVMLWKNAVIKALPRSVQADLGDVVGLVAKPIEEWRLHLIHHDMKYQATKWENDEEIKTLQLQLLKIKVAEKDTEANKNKKAARQMATTAEKTIETETVMQAPLTVQAQVVPEHQMQYQQRGRGRGRFRGKGEERVSRKWDVTHAVRWTIGPEIVRINKYKTHHKCYNTILHNSNLRHNSIINSKHLCIFLPKYSRKHRYTLPYSINKRDNGEEEGMMAASYVEIVDIWPEIAPLSNIHHKVAPHNAEENQC